MGEFIIQIIIGLVLVIIGIFNMKGNISLLHSYHRKRVKKEDIIVENAEVIDGGDFVLVRGHLHKSVEYLTTNKEELKKIIKVLWMKFITLVVLNLKL